MADFEPVLSRNWNVPDSHTLKVYESRGGYQASRKALTGSSPDGVVQVVKDSELRGRGGAGFPCGMKWSFLPKDRKETFMCINADESEPATFNNRILMERDPHQLIEGILIGCFATRAATAFLYVRFEYINAYRILESAIAEARAAGHLGKNIYGSGFDLEIYVHRGAGAYICGEETGLIESLEGKRGWPRIKPPFPAIEGTLRKPTVVNNVETLCCVPHIIERGPEWFKSMGTPKSYGPKLYCVSGHVNKQVCVELPLGITARELIDKHAGGVRMGRKAKAVVPGGISMGLMAEHELDTKLDFEDIRKPGCLGLGTAALTVMDETTSMVDYLYNTARFFAHESCGQCTPCREGTSWIYKTMKRIKGGGGRLEDLDVMSHLANNMGIMPGTTICGLADGAAWPVKNALAKFRPEFEEYIRTHQDGARRVSPLQQSIWAGEAPAHPHAATPNPHVAHARVDLSRFLRSASSDFSRTLVPTDTGKILAMATIIINGQEHTLPDGEKLNAIQAAKRVGVDIPYYCWHPALSVVANCRMCEIETGSRDPKTGEVKMIPKLVPGCQTPAKDGTVIVTDSPKVKEHQRMIMELLLINHPLDCPVCDQAGECGLQDYSYAYGQASHRFVEERTVNPRKDVSELIQLNTDRCIMCTRCVRFTREITHTGELQVTHRGNHAEIDIFQGHELDNPLSGNVVDVCPVGALLDKDFLHKQRAWFLQKHDAICTGCSTGCNISTEENRGQIWRFKPRYNPQVNDYWMCDTGRYGYKAANDPNLLSASYARTGQGLGELPIDQVLNGLGLSLSQIVADGGKIAGVISPFVTVEEAYLFATYLKNLNPSSVLALGPVPVEGVDQTFSPDMSKGRSGDTSFLVPRPFTIRAEKCPNRKGVEEILRHFQGEVIGYEAMVARVESNEFAALYAVSDSLNVWNDQTTADKLRAGVKFLAVQDTNVTPLAQLADAVIAGASFAEKAGTYVNAANRLQYAEAALPPRDGSLPDLDVFAILIGRAAAPISSSEILSEISLTVPAFSVAQGGKLPEFGATLGDTATPAPAGATFNDSWTLHRLDKGAVSAARR